MNKLKLSSILIVILVLVSSCGVLRTQYADWEYGKRNNDNRSPNFEDDIFLYQLADRFGLMALFAQVSYRDDLLVIEKTVNKSGILISEKVLEDNLHEACSYLDASVPLPEFGMPNSSFGLWSRWRGNEQMESEPCYNHNGLFYETYVYKTGDGTLQEAVIAFRGTENSRAQFWHDWRSNLASFFGFEPEQYKIAAEKLPNIIQALKLNNPNIKIYATGHSLGGGLAQQAGYLSRDILEVFTFNTSPVTNWTSLALDGKIANKYPIIHRVYNGGEVLGGLRSVTTLLTKARYGRHDIGVQVKPKKLIAGHSMKLLSCHLACLIENKNIVASHDYPASYIRNELMNSKSYCEGYVSFNRCDLNVLVE